MALPRAPRVAVVIPTADPTKQPASRCLEIVKATTSHLDVDLQVVVSSGPDFRLSRSVNRGMEQAKDADAFVLLNDDAFMDDGWLDALLDTARAHPEVGLVGAVLRFPSGRLQHAGGHIPLTPLEYLRVATEHRAPLWALRTIARRRFRQDPYMYAHYHEVDARHRLDFVTGACVLITRECYQKIGGYGDDYLFGSEDIDHSLRALEAGFELALATKCTGVHLEGASGRGMSERQKRSDAVFRERWTAPRIRKATRGRMGIHHG